MGDLDVFEKNSIVKAYPLLVSILGLGLVFFQGRAGSSLQGPPFSSFLGFEIIRSAIRKKEERKKDTQKPPIFPSIRPVKSVPVETSHSSIRWLALRYLPVQQSNWTLDFVSTDTYCVGS